MTYFDMMCLSLGVNVALLARLWAKQELLDKMEEAMRSVPPIMAAIADGKAMPKRDSKGDIRIKDLRNETN